MSISRAKGLNSTNPRDSLRAICTIYTHELNTRQIVRNSAGCLGHNLVLRFFYHQLHKTKRRHAPCSCGNFFIYAVMQTICTCRRSNVLASRTGEQVKCTSTPLFLRICLVSTTSQKKNTLPIIIEITDWP